MLWEDLTADEFAGAVEKSKGLCLIYIGALERHGAHLALGCDSLKCKAITEMAAEKEYAVVFPAGLWLGDIFGYHALDLEQKRKENRPFDGGIAVKPDMLLSIMTMLCEEIGRNGFRKILIVNSHGGNVPFLNFFVRTFAYEKHDFSVQWTWANEDKVMKPENLYKEYLENKEKYPYFTEEDEKALAHFAEVGDGGGHADFKEVALCMGIDKKYVRPDKYDYCSGLSTHKVDFLAENGISNGLAWGINFPNAYHGFPAFGCTENIGKLALDLTSDSLAKKIKILKDDEKTVLMAKRLPVD